MPDRPAVLLLADSAAGLQGLRRVADGLAVQVVEASTPVAAAEALAGQTFAVVLIDGALSGLDASGSVERVRSTPRSRSTPVILFADRALDATVLAKVYAQGAVDVLQKPLTPELAQSKVRGFVALSGEGERARREAEQLRLIVQGTKDYAIFMLDPEGRIASWNAGARLLKGYADEEIIGRHLSTFYPPEVVATGWVEHELKVAAAAGRFEDEGWRVRKDGSRFWANVVITALRGADGELLGFSKVTRDLTSRRQAEEAARQLAEEAVLRRAAETQAQLLAEQRERLRVTLTSIGDAVITTDREARVEFMNPIAEALTGWTVAEATGRPLAEVFPIINEDSREPVENPALRCLREGLIVGLANHTLLVARDGVEHPIDDSAAPIRDAQGHIVGSVLVFRDVTARRNNERQRQARAAATQALAVAATEAQGVSQLLSSLCQQMRWEAGLFWGWDAGRQALVCRGVWAQPGQTLQPFVEDSLGRAFPAGEGLPGRIWSSLQPAWIIDVARDRAFVRGGLALAAGLHSGFGCPVVVEGRPVGVIEFFTRRLEDPDAGLLEMVSTVAGTFGQFLQRRSAERALQEQTRNAEALVRVSSLLAQETDLQKLVQVVTDEATRLCGAQMGAFFYNVVGDAGESYMPYTLSGLPLEAFAGFPKPRNTQVFGPTFAGREVVRLDDVTQDPRYARNAPFHGIPPGHPPVRSYLAAAVASRSGTVHGGLFFGHAEPGMFTEGHERLLTAIAGQAAIAIDNARLFRSAQESAERLNLALGAAELGDWSWDAATDVVTLSERAAQIFGIPPGPQMTWTVMQELLHPEDRGRARAEVERVIAERVLYDIEYRVLQPSGREVWVGALGRAIFDDGRVTGMHGLVQDISERKQLEQSLRDSEARFRSLMEQAPFSIQVFSPDGRTLRVNRAWEELWGVTLEHVADYNILQDRQLEQRGVLHLIHEAFAGSPTFIPAIRYDPNETIPDRTRHADPVRWVAAVAYPIKDDLGRVREVVLVHEDVTARTRAEAALQESEGKLRLLADTIPQLAWMAAPDGVVFWYNRRWYEYTGASPEKSASGDWLDRIHPEPLPQALAAWHRSLATGEPFDMIVPVRGAASNYQSFLTRVNPLRDEAGRIIYWIGTGTDITELRRTREALAASEERLRLALDAGRMGVWDWNIRTGELQWSDSLEPLHGLRPGEFGGTFEHFQQLIHPEDRAGVGVAIREALRSGGAFYSEFRNVWPDGSLHWIAGSGKVFADESGAPLRMIGIGLDVTERRRSEQTAQFLSAASAALAEIVDFDSTLQKVATLAVPDFADWAAVDVIEAPDTLRRVAVAHTDPAKVALAHEFHERWPPRPDARSGAWHILRTGQPELIPEITDAMVTEAVTDPHASELLLRLGLRSYIGVPLTLRGRVRGVLTFVAAESGHRYDQADLALAQELAHRTAIAIENAELYDELRQADRRKDEFLATLAHELRNPLAPIRNGLNILRMAGPEKPVVEKTRTMMERQVEHLVRLVDDLLDVSRITRNRLELRKEPVSLGEIIHSAIETSRPVVQQFEHTLDVALPHAPVVLYADRIRLAQVFSNLLNNAAKYTPPRGRITLTAALQGDEAVVQVSDNGLGIPKPALRQIFEMFTQVDRGTPGVHGGLGIGLTLVKRLVELHGGTVEARSEGSGRGSEFEVRLPVRPVPGPSRDDSPEPVGERGMPSRRVLVVDDNQDAADSLRTMLQFMGHEVRTALEGTEALAVAQQFHPEVVLLDIGLPGLSGYEVCRAMRAQPWSHLALIVALTGWGQDSDRERSREAGFDEHLVKPVEIVQLTRLLARSN